MIFGGVDRAPAELPKHDKSIILLADTGYLSENKKNELAKKNVTLTTPYRKNQKKKNTDNEKKELKCRYKVENCIGRIKAYNRVHVRRDQKIMTYMGFVYLAYMKVRSNIICDPKGENRNKQNLLRN